MGRLVAAEFHLFSDITMTLFISGMMHSTNLLSVSSSRLVRGSEELSELGSVGMSELELQERDSEELVAHIFCSEFS